MDRAATAAKENPMKLSARNQLKGKIVDERPDPVPQ